MNTVTEHAALVALLFLLLARSPQSLKGDTPRAVSPSAHRRTPARPTIAPGGFHFELSLKRHKRQVTTELQSGLHSGRWTTKRKIDHILRSL